MVFRADPAAMTGTYETSDTAGPDARFGRIEDTSPIFDIARANDLAWALRAMNPADEAVSQNLVQTSPGLTVNRGDPQGDQDRIRAAAARSLHHLLKQGYTIRPDGTPVPPPRNDGQSWRNMAASMGVAISVDHTPTGAAG
jgi:hypothetical protein